MSGAHNDVIMHSWCVYLCVYLRKMKFGAHGTSLVPRRSRRSVGAPGNEASMAHVHYVCIYNSKSIVCGYRICST